MCFCIPIGFRDIHYQNVPKTFGTPYMTEFLEESIDKTAHRKVLQFLVILMPVLIYGDIIQLSLDLVYRALSKTIDLYWDIYKFIDKR